MPERARIETIVVTVALVTCAAFLVSFAVGVGRFGDDSGAVTAAPDTVLVPMLLGRVEVLNASSRSGMARAATRRLRDAGFDVVYYGNAPASAPDSSVIVDRSGNDEVARAAGVELGIGSIGVRLDSTLYVDATVIIGSDWALQPAADAEDPGGWRARVRSWLGQ